jgi:transposase InsO family protein
MKQKSYQRYTSDFKKKALGLLSLGSQSPRFPMNLRLAQIFSIAGAVKTNALRALRRENGRLQAEILKNERFINAKDAHIEIFTYIDEYYNTQRLHSSLNYKIATDFEAEILHTN